MCGCLLHAPYWGPGPQPRHVPWLGIKPATLWFAGWCSIHWAIPARACSLNFSHFWENGFEVLLVTLSLCLWGPIATLCSCPGGKLYSQLMTLWRNWSRDWSSMGSSTTLTSFIPLIMAITQVRGMLRCPVTVWSAFCLFTQPVVLAGSSGPFMVV